MNYIATNKKLFEKYTLVFSVKKLCFPSKLKFLLMSQFGPLCPFLVLNGHVTLCRLREEVISSLSIPLLSPSTSNYFIMYLLVYSSLSTPHRLNAPTRPVTIGIDFVTPDGMIVPRVLGEAALLNRTAVLVGGLLVGIWPQA